MTPRRATHAWLLAATAALLGGPAGAEPAELLRLDFDEPQIVLTPGGRMAACDVLRFADAGRELLAVGDDKVVHGWDVRADGLEYRRPLRWNLFRERKGAIYALALSPDERLAAVGGYGRKEADVAVFDRATGKVVAALTAETRPDRYQTAATVWSLAFDRDGRRLAVGHSDGSVWVWAVGGDDPKRVADPVADRKAVADRLATVRWVAFDGDEVRFARGDGSVSAVPAGGGPAPRELFRFGYPILQAVAPTDARWLAGRPLAMTKTGTVIECRSLPAGEVVHAIEFRKRPDSDDHKILPVALAADPAGRSLAVGTWWAAADLAGEEADGDPRFRPVRTGDLRLYDLTGQKPRLAAVAVFDGRAGRPALAADALAISPDGATIALAGGPDHETSLWRANGTKLERVGEPSVGVGRGVWQIGTRADGTVLSFRQAPNLDAAGPHDTGSGEWRSFDLGRPGWAADPGPPTDGPIATLNDWELRPDPEAESRWVVRRKGLKYPLPFERATDDRPTCYTFLPGTDATSTRLAVGLYWGFKLFELRPGSNPKLILRGVGHQGPVTCIAPARGGQVIVTGSSDQTVGVWAVRPWAYHPLLGAALEWAADPRTGRPSLTVTAVEAGSPAWEAGLLAGDRVAELNYNLTGWVRPDASTPAALARIEADRDLSFWLERPGADGKAVRRPAKTRMLARPQARLFPTAGHDWVLYKYADYYYASSTNGDDYMGWVIGGKGAKDTPEYHPAARFRDVFARPLKARDELIGLVREPARPLTRTYLPPAVTVTASAAAVAPGKPVSLKLAAAPRADDNGRPVPLEKVELWLGDDVLLRAWTDFPDGKFSADIDLAAETLRVGRNRLTLVAHARTRGEASVEVENAAVGRPRPAVRGLAVGVDRYPYLAAAFQLTAAESDARLIRAGFERLARDGVARSATVELLLNEQATPAAVLAAIDRLAKDPTLGPDDWAVVFLAGHGLAEPDGGPAGPAAPGGRAPAAGPSRMKPGTWLFCGAAPAFGPGAAAGGAGGGEREVLDLSRGDAGQLIGKLKGLDCTVPGGKLLERLATVNCRKLVLLDSCHSGAIEQDPGRDLRPGGRGVQVLTATAPDETATEVELPVDRDGATVTERHGVFSVAVYHALGRDRAAADRNKDGLLTLEEVHRAAAAGVRAARREAGLDRPGRTQTVLACPPDLRNVVLVPVR